MAKRWAEHPLTSRLRAVVAAVAPATPAAPSFELPTGEFTRGRTPQPISPREGPTGREVGGGLAPCSGRRHYQGPCATA